MSKEEKEEQSWEFLYNITEKVENNFSSQDNQDILSLGKSMDKVGVIYYHIID